MDPANNSNLTTENMDPVPAYNPVPIITPPPPATSPTSPILQAQVLSSGGGKPKVKWGKGVLVGGIFALVVLVVGTIVGVKLGVGRNQNAKPSKASGTGCLSADLSQCQIGPGVCWRARINNACKRADGTVDNTLEIVSGGDAWNGEACYNCDDTNNTFPADRNQPKCSTGSNVEINPDCGGGPTPTPTPVSNFDCTQCGNKVADAPVKPTDPAVIGCYRQDNGGAACCSCLDGNGQCQGYWNCVNGNTYDVRCTQRGPGEICATSTPTPTPTPTPVSEPTPTPAPTPTPVGESACYQVKIFKEGVEITASDIRLGDVVTFRGFASATNTTVAKIRFVITKGGTAQTPVDKDATLVGNLYQADYEVTIDTATSYSVTAAIAP